MLDMKFLSSVSDIVLWMLNYYPLAAFLFITIATLYAYITALKWPQILEKAIRLSLIIGSIPMTGLLILGLYLILPQHSVQLFLYTFLIYLFSELIIWLIIFIPTALGIILGVLLHKLTSGHR